MVFNKIITVKRKTSVPVLLYIEKVHKAHVKYPPTSRSPKTGSYTTAVLRRSLEKQGWQTLVSSLKL